MSLGAGPGMLTDSVRALLNAWRRCRESWDDRNAESFHAEFLAPIEPAARQSLVAMERLSVVCSDALRACE